MYTMFSDTIAAISTPHGKGGVAVIRISGEDAFAIAEKFIFPKSKKSFADIRANSVFLADVKTLEGKLLDESLITIFRAPRSYTGEDVVEISCHGGILLTQNILSAAFSAGAVQAGPGEFTRRAFSAGKLSLTEAESVIGMIDAKTNAALTLAQRGISGSLRKKTEKIYTDITSVIGNIYAIIDFPDEDLEQMTRSDMEREMDSIIAELDSLKNSYRTGHAVCEGIPTVICGKPNTGKSTILNLLAENERAIVTDIAGTTRDVISETVVCGSALSAPEKRSKTPSSFSQYSIHPVRSTKRTRKCSLLQETRRTKERPSSLSLTSQTRKSVSAKSFLQSLTSSPFPQKQKTARLFPIK